MGREWAERGVYIYIYIYIYIKDWFKPIFLLLLTSLLALIPNTHGRFCPLSVVNQATRMYLTALKTRNLELCGS
jgi:hypothetical protein